MSENYPQRGPEQPQPEARSEQTEVDPLELSGQGILAASQPEVPHDTTSSPEPQLRIRASTTVAFRLSHENRRQLHERPTPVQPPEEPAPWGKDFPMRRSGGKSND